MKANPSGHMADVSNPLSIDAPRSICFAPPEANRLTGHLI